jgi:hypothetical protein
MKILVWLVICLSRDCWERTLTLSQKENLVKLGAWYALLHDVCYVVGVCTFHSYICVMMLPNPCPYMSLTHH